MPLKHLLTALLVCLTLGCAMAEETAETAEASGQPAIETDDDKTLYVMGLALSRNLKQFEFTEDELAKLLDGLADGVLDHEPKAKLEEFAPRIDTMLRARMDGIVGREKEAGETFRAELAQEPGAESMDNGMIYRELEPGQGASPGPADRVKLHYHGTLRDGSVFDSSLQGDDPQPASFAISGVIPCFGQGLQKMKVGGKSKLTCPPELAYGDRGSPPSIKPGATLVFEVELLEIVQSEPESAPEE